MHFVAVSHLASTSASASNPGSRPKDSVVGTSSVSSTFLVCKKTLVIPLILVMVAEISVIIIAVLYATRRRIILIGLFECDETHSEWAASSSKGDKGKSRMVWRKENRNV